MIKKVLATAAVAASVVGASVAAAVPALAIGNDSGPTSASGNGAHQSFGNSATFGNMSPQMALIQGSLNKPCVALPTKVNTIPVPAGLALQDVPILSSSNNQQCVENSTQVDGDDPLSHLLDDLALLSGNGAANH
ncbi:rodlin [Streptomyces sp. NBC_00582]|uniref:rodlin n=1 Tax=Streptomyces sp. NBC_00582 TaxID=2975783 RepID=UPI0010630490|nr:rodlin [Streptomyces sp. NBC_00582]WUB64563.1 rodlin [Streptomyces sp. NBC_00582]